MEKSGNIISAVEDKNRILHAFIVTSLFIMVLWFVRVFEFVTGAQLFYFGIFPGKITGLIGIITSPVIHASFSHLISNSGGLFFSMLTTIYLYRQSAYKTISIIWVLSGIIIWIFGREAYHIGASGVVYGLMSFLFFSGIFRRDKRSIALSLVVIFLYGSMIWGLFPVDVTISNEAHIAGAIIGLACAFGFRKLDPPGKYEWEPTEEVDESDPDEYEMHGETKMMKLNSYAGAQRF
ncbi:rhomboid family intramembrane serine protease [Ignavibacteria bacterium CHB1]|nr:rhomboid family intramembrane serine protease [Ignavibacteria bacterium CHB1]